MHEALMLFLLAMSLKGASVTWMDVYCYQEHGVWALHCCHKYDDLNSCLVFSTTHRCNKYDVQELLDDMYVEVSNGRKFPVCRN
jgi:hypothetical protein